MVILMKEIIRVNDVGDRVEDNDNDNETGVTVSNTVAFFDYVGIHCFCGD